MCSELFTVASQIDYKTFLYAFLRNTWNRMFFYHQNLLYLGKKLCNFFNTQRCETKSKFHFVFSAFIFVYILIIINVLTCNKIMCKYHATERKIIILYDYITMIFFTKGYISKNLSAAIHLCYHLLFSDLV